MPWVPTDKYGFPVTGIECPKGALRKAFHRRAYLEGVTSVCQYGTNLWWELVRYWPSPGDPNQDVHEV